MLAAVMDVVVAVGLLGLLAAEKVVLEARELLSSD